MVHVQSHRMFDSSCVNVWQLIDLIWQHCWAAAEVIELTPVNARRAPWDLQHHRSPKKESSRTIRILMERWSIRISAWLPVKPSQDPEINTNTENASQNTAYLDVKNAAKCRKLTRFCDFLYRNDSKPHQIMRYFMNLTVFTWLLNHFIRKTTTETNKNHFTYLMKGKIQHSVNKTNDETTDKKQTIHLFSAGRLSERRLLGWALTPPTPAVQPRPPHGSFRQSGYKWQKKLRVVQYWPQEWDSFRNAKTEL